LVSITIWRGPIAGIVFNTALLSQSTIRTEVGFGLPVSGFTTFDQLAWFRGRKDDETRRAAVNSEPDGSQNSNGDER